MDMRATLATQLPIAGLGFGGGLGAQLGQALDAPRQGAWTIAAKLAQMAGQGDGTPYESGSDLLSGMFGMDAEDPMTQGLGMGVEAMTDPLTYAGGWLGRMGGGALGKKVAAGGAKEASLAGKVAAVADEPLPALAKKPLWYGDPTPDELAAIAHLDKSLETQVKHATLLAPGSPAFGDVKRIDEAANKIRSLRFDPSLGDIAAMGLEDELTNPIRAMRRPPTNWSAGGMGLAAALPAAYLMGQGQQ